MRILFVWTGLTSYMGDCWRQLAQADDIELKVVVDVSGSVAKAVDFQAEKVLAGIDYELVTDPAQLDLARFSFRPDLLFIVGWHSAVCRRFLTEARFTDVPKVCCFDMPWRWKLRCLIAPLVLGRLVRKYDAAFVPGSVAACYAKWLGFKRIHTGLFAIDTERFSSVSSQTAACGPARKYLLYIGRNSAEKRLDDVRRAHALYRAQGGPLELALYGKGLEGGFVSPEDVPGLMRKAAAFVLASDFDPWPLVLLEAMSAGCPVIASDRCTNRPELGQNWQVFKTGDVAQLAAAMKRAESGGPDDAQRREDLARAQAYDCRRWVVRIREIVKELVK